MINIKELSVGNWIKISGTPVQILGIRTESQVYVLETEEADYAYAIDADIEPIEITPEILEKNGWKFNGCYSDTIDSIGRMVEYYHFEGILRLYIDDKPYTTIGPGQKYIHQLQNALTLCGINKEIKL